MSITCRSKRSRGLTRLNHFIQSGTGKENMLSLSSIERGRILLFSSQFTSSLLSRMEASSGVRTLRSVSQLRLLSRSAITILFGKLMTDCLVPRFHQPITPRTKVLQALMFLTFQGTLFKTSLIHWSIVTSTQVFLLTIPKLPRY